MDAKAEEDPMLPMTTDEIETAPGARLVVVTGDGETHEVERAELVAAGSMVQLHCPAIVVPTLEHFETEELLGELDVRSAPVCECGAGDFNDDELAKELRSRGWTVTE